MKNSIITACLAFQKHRDYIRTTALQPSEMRRSTVCVSLAHPNVSMSVVDTNDLSESVGIPFIHFILFYLLSRRNGRLIMTAVIDKEAACA